ncbi:pentapeptide repeat-containing protein [Nocardia sp. NPDC050175]|uniref:pentapeptide repeat-containing protein n=1 Tax=Nocardia sp. NPDC050175 TaxID=3364317 RepID=UPI0037A50928
MFEGETTVTGTDTGNLARRWSVAHRRSIWTGIAIASAGGAGFGAAVLAGASPAFGQPLATLLGGAGVLAAGLLAYFNGQHSRAQTEAHHKADMDRERERHAEDSRRAQVSTLRDRYTAIAAQIADTNSAAIRQAGVYALTALADDWHAFGEDDERQVCINLLQWYLRVPFPVGDDPEKPDLSEREIRQTIVGILTERRRRPAEHPKSWATTVISLHQASLPNCVFWGINLADLHLPDVDLSNAKLAGADLTNADLHGADLHDADLHDADLRSADLKDAKLAGAKLTGAKLDDAHLFRSILVEADLANATLTGAYLNSANLNGAFMYRANLHGADLMKANLTSAQLGFAKLNGTTLIHTDLTGAYLHVADLNGADLTGAKLLGANLTGADLNGANLHLANLTGVDLTDAKLDDASFIHAKYDETTQWPEGFAPPSPEPNLR